MARICKCSVISAIVFEAEGHDLNRSFRPWAENEMKPISLVSDFSFHFSAHFNSGLINGKYALCEFVCPRGTLFDIEQSPLRSAANGCGDCRGASMRWNADQFVARSGPESTLTPRPSFHQAPRHDLGVRSQQTTCA